MDYKNEYISMILCALEASELQSQFGVTAMDVPDTSGLYEVFPNFQEILNTVISGKSRVDEVKQYLENTFPGEFEPILVRHFEKRVKELLTHFSVNTLTEHEEGIWNRLEVVHTILCSLSYKENLSLGLRLGRFIYDFERIDDPFVRERIIGRLRLDLLDYS